MGQTITFMLAETRAEFQIVALQSA
jgi:hypothetical protein